MRRRSAGIDIGVREQNNGMVPTGLFIQSLNEMIERLMVGEMMPSPNRKLAPSMSPASSSGRCAASSL